MTSLEENLVGRELINALDKSPEAFPGCQKSGMSFDYRPRFDFFYEFGNNEILRFASADSISRDSKLRKYSRDSGKCFILENLSKFFESKIRFIINSDLEIFN